MTTEERLAALETELARAKRRFQWLAVVGALVVACVSIFLAVWARPAVVEARRFVLVDEYGNNRADLGVNEPAPAAINGPWLILRDEESNIRVALGMFKDGPLIDLRDENGKTVWKTP